VVEERPNPFAGYRFAEVDFDKDLFAQLPVADLVHGTMNATVEEADPGYGRRLFEELDRRGRDAWWEAVLLWLDFLSKTTVGGKSGAASVAELRRSAAQQRNQVPRLYLETMAAYREAGEDAARRIWQNASAAARAGAGRVLFVTACADGTSGPARLTPTQCAALSRELVGLS